MSTKRTRKRTTRLTATLVGMVSWLVATFVFSLHPIHGQPPKIADQTPLTDRINYQPTEAWVKDFFEKRKTVADDVANLFRDLGNSDYRKRKAAQKELQSLPYVPKALIEEYSRAQNPEIRFFVKSLTARRAELERMYFHLVVDSIAQHGFKGFAQSLISLIDEENETYLDWMLPIAIGATVVPDDRAALEKMTSSDVKLERRIAIWGLTSLEVSADQPFDDTWVGDDPEFKLARALSLFSVSDSRSIPMLVELLDSTVLPVRIHSETALRTLTGQNLGVIGGSSEEDRKPAVKAWSDWLTNADLDNLKFFKPNYLLDEYRLLGNHLVGFKTGDSECGLMILSPKGTLVTKIGESPCFWAEFLSNGNLLCTLRIGDQPAIVEMDHQGNIVWQYDSHFLLKCHALPNGNVLVCVQEDRRLIEVNRDKQIVWGMVTNGKCNDVVVLHDGRKVIATDEGLFLVDLEGNEKTIFDDFDVSGIELLADGELLATSWKKHKVFQISLDGKKRWEYSVNQAMNAHQSIDGTFAVSSGSQGFVFLDEKRKPVRTLSGFSGRVILK